MSIFDDRYICVVFFFKGRYICVVFLLTSIFFIYSYSKAPNDALMVSTYKLQSKVFENYQETFENFPFPSIRKSVTL